MSSGDWDSVGQGRDPVSRTSIRRGMRTLAVLLVLDLAYLLLSGAGWSSVFGVVAVVLGGGVFSFGLVLLGFDAIDRV